MLSHMTVLLVSLEKWLLVMFVVDGQAALSDETPRLQCCSASMQHAQQCEQNGQPVSCTSEQAHR
jgi:hypothetical protein